MSGWSLRRNCVPYLQQAPFRALQLLYGAIPFLPGKPCYACPPVQPKSCHSRPTQACKGKSRQMYQRAWLLQSCEGQEFGDFGIKYG